MTYIARVNNAFDGFVYLTIENGRQISKIRIPGKPELVKAALSTYKDLRYRPAEDVPKSIRSLTLEKRFDLTV